MYSPEVEKTAVKVLLTPQNASVMDVLGKEKKPATPEKISNQKDANPATIQDVLKSLSKDGLVEQESTGYSLTPFGKQVYSRLQGIVRAIPRIDRGY